MVHVFVLDDFIFEASHEECDVTKFNQRNGVAWILPGELSFPYTSQIAEASFFFSYLI